LKKLQNTLYLLTPNSYLFCQNETIAVKVGGEEKIRIPAHTIESIICFGNTTISTPFIAFCGERNIGLSFHSDYGKFYGRIYGPVSGNVLLRKKQFINIDNHQFTVDFVRMILYDKLANSKNLLLRSKREHFDENAKAKLGEAAEQIASLAQQLADITQVDSLRGIEGVAASTYFGVFDCMIKTNKEDFRFITRSKRPPENNVNALLSFLYMLLKNDMQSALESVGLDPAAGFLHTLRPGRPSLALDLMEELRAPLCDRLALSLINLNQLKPDDFVQDPSGISLTDKARKMVLNEWQTRKQENITHPFLQEKIPIGLIPFVQAQLLARFFRGDLDQYPPFLWR
jgi:CRISPR-associated protein Cas1